MADNIDVTPGTGSTVATEDVGGVQHQKVKVEYGADGAATLVENVAPLPIMPGMQTTTDYDEVAINVAGSGDNSIVSATASQTTRVYGFFLFANGGAVNVKWRDGSTDFTPALPLADKGYWSLPRDGRPWFKTTANTALQLNLSSAIQVSGRLYYKKST